MESVAKIIFAAVPALSTATVIYGQTVQTEATAVDSMSSGEVKKVDKDAGKMTIKHGPLKNLGMDGMTMVLRVKDKGMLDEVNVGDKIHFNAEEPNGQLTVTQLEKQQ